MIFLTARAGTEARIESLDAGADDYLSKPFDELELLARVGNLIRATGARTGTGAIAKGKNCEIPAPKSRRDDYVRGT